MTTFTGVCGIFFNSYSARRRIERFTAGTRFRLRCLLCAAIMLSSSSVWDITPDTYCFTFSGIGSSSISSVEAYRSSMVFSSSVLTIASYSSKNAYSLVSCFVITTSTSIFLQFLPACNAFRISAKKKAAVDILQQLFIRLLWFLLVLLCISTESKETASDALPVPCQSEQVLSSIIPKKIAGYNYFTSKIRIFSAGTETSPKITSLIAAACAASRPSVCTTTLALSPSR